MATHVQQEKVRTGQQGSRPELSDEWYRAVVSAEHYELFRSLRSMERRAKAIEALERYAAQFGKRPISDLLLMGNRRERRVLETLLFLKACRGDFDFDLFPEILNDLRPVFHQLMDNISEETRRHLIEQIRGRRTDLIAEVEILEASHAPSVGDKQCPTCNTIDLRYRNLRGALAYIALFMANLD